ncbi:hypothetical protein CGLO_12362 [Colletotrichum gloeosporioides Cg-14]|uniref:Uncharacterized protein n=1 Tax=Colletotrichum gloeosporioides (strain Cg-14) TaxID=1237896 RepID=T0K610_COLGC|nr:hypothetical protein CGLO_12362 [Colletotrichum gloeosporioides Cg-14]
MFQRSAAKLPFSPKSGMKVFPDGVGALHLAYEELKKKLASEGLFDAR